LKKGKSNDFVPDTGKGDRQREDGKEKGKGETMLHSVASFLLFRRDGEEKRRKPKGGGKTKLEGKGKKKECPSICLSIFLPHPPIQERKERRSTTSARHQGKAEEKKKRQQDHRTASPCRLFRRKERKKKGSSGKSLEATNLREGEKGRKVVWISLQRTYLSPIRQKKGGKELRHQSKKVGNTGKGREKKEGRGAAG